MNCPRTVPKYVWVEKIATSWFGFEIFPLKGKISWPNLFWNNTVNLKYSSWFSSKYLCDISLLFLGKPRTYSIKGWLHFPYKGRSPCWLYSKLMSCYFIILQAGRSWMNFFHNLNPSILTGKQWRQKCERSSKSCKHCQKRRTRNGNIWNVEKFVL